MERTLKMISGFLKADKGQILIDGHDITELDPEKRPVSTVFQSYALFPHMTVLENVIYGLKFQGIKKKKAREMGMEYLKIVDMEEYAGFSIGEISGGQQQRVALVRSLIIWMRNFESRCVKKFGKFKKSMRLQWFL